MSSKESVQHRANRLIEEEKKKDLDKVSQSETEQESDDSSEGSDEDEDIDIKARDLIVSVFEFIIVTDYSSTQRVYNANGSSNTARSTVWTSQTTT